MKKICTLLLISSLMMVCLSACSAKPKASMINSKRRFAEYVEPKQPSTQVIDLSEGPKLRYDANFGPQAPEFDIRIKNPY